MSAITVAPSDCSAIIFFGAEGMAFSPVAGVSFVAAAVARERTDKENNDMQILVAGAAGGTGLRLINQLESRGHHPIVLVREESETGILPIDVELRQGGLTEEDGARYTVFGDDVDPEGTAARGDVAAVLADPVNQATPNP